MNDRTYTMTVITILNDGKKITADITHGGGRFAWNNAMKSYGSNLRFDGIKVEDINKVVVINGTDVFTYAGGEPAEILGL